MVVNIDAAFAEWSIAKHDFFIQKFMILLFYVIP